MELLGPKTRDPQYIYRIVKRAPGKSATWGRDSVNREHLYPDAALRPDRVLDERVLVERQ